MGLTGQTELALTGLLGQTELVLTCLKIDLLKVGLSRLQTELRTHGIQRNMAKSF